MPADLVVILGHRPGELTRLVQVTGGVGVSIGGLAAFTGRAGLSQVQMSGKPKSMGASG